MQALHVACNQLGICQTAVRSIVSDLILRLHTDIQFDQLDAGPLV